MDKNIHLVSSISTEMCAVTNSVRRRRLVFDTDVYFSKCNKNGGGRPFSILKIPREPDSDLELRRRIYTLFEFGSILIQF